MSNVGHISVFFCVIYISDIFLRKFEYFENYFQLAPLNENKPILFLERNKSRAFNSKEIYEKFQLCG